jgi:hypothetical protein
MRQMPNEETHNSPNDKTSQQLAKAQQVKEYSRIMRRRRLRATVEGLEHGGAYRRWSFSLTMLYTADMKTSKSVSALSADRRIDFCQVDRREKRLDGSSRREVRKGAPQAATGYS